MELIEIYKGIIETAGLTIDENHGAYYDFGAGSKMPYLVKDRHLVLPTNDILRNPDWSKQIAFHPLSENVARKESLIQKELNRMFNMAMNATVGEIMDVMVTYCADKDKQKTMNHRQTAILSHYPDADEKSVKNWTAIDNKINEMNSYVKVVVLRERKLNPDEPAFSRTAFVTFPFYDELCKLEEGYTKDNKVFGVSLRKKDIKGFKALFEYLVKGAAEPDKHYSFGSRSMVAPTFHAFINASYNVFKELQRTANLLRIETLPLLWGEYVADLTPYKGVIPILEGNDGELTEGERRKQETAIPTVATAPNAAPLQPMQPVAQPVAQPAPMVQQPMQQPLIPVQPLQSGYHPPISPNQPATTGEVKSGKLVMPWQRQPLQAQPVNVHPNAVTPANPTATTTAEVKTGKFQPVIPTGPTNPGVYPTPQMGYGMMGQPQMMGSHIRPAPNYGVPMGYQTHQPYAHGAPGWGGLGMQPQMMPQVQQWGLPQVQPQPMMQPGYIPPIQPMGYGYR